MSLCNKYSMKRLHEDFLDNVEQQELTAPKEVIKKNIQDYEWRIPIVCRDTLDAKVQRLADVTTGLTDYAIEIGSDFVEFQFAFNADFKTVTQAVTFVKTLATLLSRAFGDFNLIFYRQNSDYSNIVFKTEVLDDIFNQNRTSYGYYDNEYKKLMSLLMTSELQERRPGRRIRSGNVRVVEEFDIHLSAVDVDTIFDRRPKRNPRLARTLRCNAGNSETDCFELS